jgi:signal transduction histidine kinase
LLVLAISVKENVQFLIVLGIISLRLLADIQDKLFAKSATKSDTGSGLRLYISKGIVEAHGGRIWAENNSDGKGATFSFILPI